MYPPVAKHPGLLIRLKIAKLVIEYKTDLALLQSGFESYSEFLCTDQPDVSIQVRSGKPPRLSTWQLVFEAGGTWKIHRKPGVWAFSMYSPIFPDGWYQTLLLDEEMKRGILYIPVSPVNLNWTDVINSALEKLMVLFLTQKRWGIMVHASAVIDGPVGRLFCGTSGDGKSTTARLWQTVPGVRVLSDERVVLRKIEDRFWMFGTPWHSDARQVSAEGAPLDQLFILNHATQNQAELLTPAQALTQMLVRTFPPYWDPGGMEFTLDFLSDLCQAVPCRALGFTPLPAVIDFVRCLELAPSTP